MCNFKLWTALYQGAQIMLGMLQPPQEIPNIQPAASQHPQQPAPTAQQPNAQTTPLPGQSSLRDQTSAPVSSSTLIAQHSNPLLPSHPLQPIQPNRGGHINYSHLAQPTMPAVAASAPISTPLQQLLHINNMPPMPLQPPLPPQPRPPSMPAFPHPNYSHLAPNAGFQHPQLHHLQPMFHVRFKSCFRILVFLFTVGTVDIVGDAA